MREIFSLIAGVLAILGMIGGYVAMYFAPITFVVLLVLKLTGAVAMPWFGWVTTLSTIGTPLWMVVCGLLTIFISLVAGAISSVFDK